MHKHQKKRRKKEKKRRDRWRVAERAGLAALRDFTTTMTSWLMGGRKKKAVG